MQRAIIRPTRAGTRKVLTIRVRITVAGLPANAEVEITDAMLQAGRTVTGWSPHPTELRWTTGVVGG